MSSDFHPTKGGATTGPAGEQRGQAGVEYAADLVALGEDHPGAGLTDMTRSARPAGAVEVSETASGIGAPLLVGALSALALTLAVLTPVMGVRIAGLVIVAVTVLIGCRLLARRGGGVR